MWKVILGIIIGLVIIIAIIKISTRRNMEENVFSSIKRRFDDVCKKIGLKSGC